MSTATIELLFGAIGFAILHFLWQGAVIGAITGLAVSANTQSSPCSRYAISLGGLLACVIAFGTTCAVSIASVDSWARPPSAVAVPMEVGAAASAGSLPLALAWLWLAGMALLGVRYALQWRAVHRLRTDGISEPDSTWRSAFATLARQAGVRQTVRLVRSSIAEVPMVIGVVSPIVVVPVAAFTSLTPEQLRTILIHELAHIRRRDHIVNALQALIEIVLFFHPVVWWLSSRVRTEREHCCDDTAAGHAESPRVFAEALARLESIRNPHWQAALAANGGPLMSRITRLVEPAPSPRPALLRTALALAAGAVTLGVGIASAVTPEDEATATLVQTLRDSVERGGMTAGQAQEIYETTIFPKSEAHQKFHKEIEAVTQRINESIAAGETTPELGAMKLAEVKEHARLYEHAAFSMDVLGMSKADAHVSAIRAELDRRVAAGEMTQDEADKRIANVQARVAAQAEQARHVNAIRAEIKSLVEKGEITEQEAAEKIAALEAGAKKRARTEALVAEIHAAVAAGDLTKEEAAEKLRAIKAHPSKDEQLHKRYVEVVARIKEAVEAGEITPEQAQFKEIRAAAHAEREARKASELAKADAIAAKIEAEVEAGKLTREQADAKLHELHEHLARKKKPADAPEVR